MRTYVILLQELLRIVVTVDRDFCNRIVDSRILAAGLNTRVQPRQDKFQAVALLDLVHELINGEGSGHRRKETLDRCLVTVDIQQTTDDLGSAHGVHALHVHLDELRETVLIQIQDKVVHEIEAVTNDYEWKLIRKLGLLQKVLDLLGIIVIGLPADALNLTNLTSPRSSLDILEVNLRILTQIYDRTEIIIETYQTAGQPRSHKFCRAYPRSS
jgi:hypothetical protein